MLAFGKTSHHGQKGKKLFSPNTMLSRPTACLFFPVLSFIVLKGEKAMDCWHPSLLLCAPPPNNIIYGRFVHPQWLGTIYFRRVRVHWPWTRGLSTNMILFFLQPVTTDGNLCMDNSIHKNNGWCATMMSAPAGFGMVPTSSLLLTILCVLYRIVSSTRLSRCSGFRRVVVLSWHCNVTVW